MGGPGAGPTGGEMPREEHSYGAPRPAGLAAASPAALRDLLKDFKQGMTGSDLHVRDPLQQPCRPRIQERREAPVPGAG